MPIRDGYRPGEVCWVDLNAHDMGAAAIFYGRVFGWADDPVPSGGGPPYAIFRLRGKGVAGLGQMETSMQAAGVPACWNTYVRVDDCAATAAKVRSLGGTVTVPPMPIVGAGTLAFFADPQGANFAVWQPAGHPGADLRDEPGALAWLECNTRDVDAAKAFYGALFGWTFTDMNVGGKGYTIIQVGATGIGGMMAIAPEWGAVPPHWLPYFGTANVDALAAEVRTAGGRVVAGPMDISPEHGRFVICADAQGAVFAGHQAAMAAAAPAGAEGKGEGKGAGKGAAKPRAKGKPKATAKAKGKGAKKGARKAPARKGKKAKRRGR